MGPTLGSLVRPFALLLVIATPARAKQSAGRIADNSFLLEEAYNQERRVVQHIMTFSRVRGGGAWEATLTDEWPLGGQRHQLSYTARFLKADGPGGGGSGFGDLALNYRWQALGGAGRTWVAPRLTVILPVGDPARGRGAGGVGVEIAVPVSVVLTPRLTSHWNAAVLFNPGAKRRGTEGVSARVVRLAGSMIADLSSKVNVLLEAVWESSHDVVGPGRTIGADHWALSPGIRWAHDFESGLQIVPGVAYTINLGRAGDPDAVFLYLSFEYPFGRKP